MVTLKSKYINLKAEERYNKCPNPLVGLTGGIATGKSTVSEIFKDQGITVINADGLIHEIYAQAETQSFIKDLCPQAMTNQGIDFPTLRKEFFSDNTLKEKIEKHLYGKLPDAFRSKLPDNDKDLVIYDVPLLFEKKMKPLFDQVIMVTVQPEIQIERLKGRDGKDLETHKKVIAAQLPLQEKAAASDFVIDNSGDRDELRLRVLNLYHELVD